MHAIGHGGCSRILHFKALRQLPGSDFSLLALLGLTRKSEATDPRDTVFAMLPFASDVQQGMLQTDYSVSLLELYINVVIRSVYTHHDLDFIGYCTHTHEKPNPQHPPWLPDWTDRSEQRPFAKRVGQADGSFNQAYSASGSSLPHQPRDGLVVLPVTNGRAIFRDFCIDTIRT